MQHYMQRGAFDWEEKRMEGGVEPVWDVHRECIDFAGVNISGRI